MRNISGSYRMSRQQKWAFHGAPKQIRVCFFENLMNHDVDTYFFKLLLFLGIEDEIWEFGFVRLGK